MPKIQISKDLLKVNGLLVLGVVTATVKVEQKNEKLWAQLQACGVEQKHKFTNKDLIATIPPIKALRDTYKVLGLKPSDYRGSNEALLRRIIDDKGLYQINTVVDINNLISVDALRSVGSYDLANLAGDIVFRAGTKGEVYTGTNKRTLSLEHLPLLADEHGPFGSPTSDSDRALITDKTQQVMTVIFSFDGEAKLQEQLDDIVKLLQQYASATNVNTYLVRDKAQNLLLDDEDLGEAAGASAATSLIFSAKKDPRQEASAKIKDDLTNAASTDTQQVLQEKLTQAIEDLTKLIKEENLQEELKDVISSILSQAAGSGKLESVEYLVKSYASYISDEELDHSAQYATTNGYDKVRNFLAEQLASNKSKQSSLSVSNVPL